MKGKKERTLAITLGALLLVLGITLYFKGNNISRDLEKNPNMGQIVKGFKRKELESRIDRKLKSKSLVRILESLSFEKLEVADEILADKIFVNFLNEGHLEGDKVKSINYEEAVNQEKIKKGLQDLGVLSPELKNYLDNRYPGRTYGIVGNKLKVPEVIKTRERLLKLIPEESLKNLIEELPDGKIEILNNIFIKNPEVVRVIESKKIEDYEDINKLYELSKNLYEIGNLDPRVALELNRMFPDFDFRKAALYGNLYLSDSRLEQGYLDEYKTGNYTFKNPFIKLNPFGRTPLSALVKFKNDLKDFKVRVTVLGEEGMPNYTYISSYNNEEGVSIVGLYPRSKNKVNLELLTEENRVVDSNQITIETGYLNDMLPSIYIETRVPDSIQPGMNLAIYNSDNQGMPFIFDSLGNIRYVLDTGRAIRNLNELQRDADGDWLVSNDEDSFIMDILGRIIGRMGKIDKKLPQPNKEVQYLVRNNNVLTVVGFVDKGPNPYCLFSELGLDSKRVLFRAKLFYDKGKKEDNNVVKGERIPLFPGNER